MVVSELIRPEPAPAVQRWADAQESDDLALTSVSVAELLFGIVRLPQGARRSQLAHRADVLLREGFDGRILPFDAAAAERYAELAASRKQAGRPIDIANGQIAAICRLRGAELATRNTRDFKATSISLVDPWTSSPG
ncbi:MAG: type II toxin-antitoxin system VapC family toxin [Solirubrobacteraceae bacterium MAG38_C4-C5]|nr:type II toxin-antitoxin system VapC family toxin [Candidatus Siliceabacter maunaloa]